jgi:Tfp pilus assembly protein PilZ
MYAKTLTIWIDTCMQVWSAIDPLMMTGGLFVKTSQSFLACTGFCLQYK